VPTEATRVSVVLPRAFGRGISRAGTEAAESSKNCQVKFFNKAVSEIHGISGGTRTPSDHYFSMSERVTACRRKAGECELAARMATDPDARIMFRELAQMWLEMASELEQFEAAKQTAVIPSQ
jgi:hypothetical protein